jgi:YfiR/HmsC-like
MNWVFKRRLCLAAFLGWQALLWLAAGSFTARAQPAEPSEYQVKAAFLYNFGKFVTWPTNVFSDTNAPLVIGVFGPSPFHGDLGRIVHGKIINGHPVVVKQIKVFDDLKKCQILFISASERDRLGGVLHELDDAGILTVTENLESFDKSGVMINFIMENERIRFEINDVAAERVGLKINSKLLILAKRTVTSRGNSENKKFLCALYP